MLLYLLLGIGLVHSQRVVYPHPPEVTNSIAHRQYYSGDLDWDCSFSLYSHSISFHDGKEYDSSEELQKVLCLENSPRGCLLTGTRVSNISFLGGYYKIFCLGYIDNLPQSDFINVTYAAGQMYPYVYGYASFFENLFSGPGFNMGSFNKSYFYVGASPQRRVSDRSLFGTAPFMLSFSVRGVCVHNVLLLHRPYKVRSNKVHILGGTKFFSFDSTIVACYSDMQALSAHRFNVFKISDLVPNSLPILRNSKFFGKFYPGRVAWETFSVFCSQGILVSSAADCEDFDVSAVYSVRAEIEDDSFVDKLFTKVSGLVSKMLGFISDLVFTYFTRDVSRIFTLLISWYFYSLTQNVLVTFVLSLFLQYQFS